MKHREKGQGWLAAVRRWLGRRMGAHRSTPQMAKPLSVVFLPQEAICLEGQLRMGLPADFSVESNSAEQTVFVGQKSGLRLSVGTIPFSLSLHTLTQARFQRFFGAAQGMRSLCIRTFTHGDLNGVPLLCVRYTFVDGQTRSESVVQLLQPSKLLICIVISDLTTDNAHLIEPMLASISLHPISVR